jgi:hypothetical protein
MVIGDVGSGKVINAACAADAVRFSTAAHGTIELKR